MNRIINRRFWIFSVIVLLTLMSCTSGGGIPFPDEKKGAQRIFQEGERAFETGQYDKALSCYQAFLGKVPTDRFSDVALYKTGMIYRITGKNSDALTAFSRFIHEFPRSERVGDAMVEILTLQFDAGQMNAVISKGNDFIRTNRAKIIKPALYLVVGDAYLSNGNHLAAARLYYRAWYTSTEGDRTIARFKLDSVVKRLTARDIQALISGVMDRPMMGVLLYKLGEAFEAEGNHDAAAEVFAAFKSQFSEPPSSPDARKPAEIISDQQPEASYTIGCLLPLSGSYAVMGQRVLDAIELAVSQMNQADAGISFRLVVRDTHSDPKVSARAVEELDREPVGVILGPMITAEAAAVKAQAMQIPIIVFTQRDGVADIGDYVFRHFMTPAMQVQTLAETAVKQLGVKHFVVLYPKENYGKRYLELFRKAARQEGATIVGVETYDPEGVDFSAPVKKVAALFRASSRKVPVYSPAPPVSAEETGTLDNPRFSDFVPNPATQHTVWNPATDAAAIFIPDSARKSSMIISQLAYHDVRETYLLGTNLWHSPDLLTASEHYMQNALIVDGFFPEGTDANVRAFVSDFQKIFDRTPDVIEAMAYDSAMMVFQTIRQQRGASESRRALRDALLDLYNFSGVSGRTTFEPNGEAKKELWVLGVKKGRFVPFSPERISGSRSRDIWR